MQGYSALVQAAIMKRLASRSNPVRSYICRFNIFSRLFKPSTGPLLTVVDLLGPLHSRQMDL